MDIKVCKIGSIRGTGAGVQGVYTPEKIENYALVASKVDKVFLNF